ncbi:hypothetical protein PW5551_04710 [Petrotoga sp. 9PW.55.5.1]|uniref:hypothetical protein n=1 Tax=Petrotoga sp. 9PW.55.5.1 TaxID=1308979 RepID=UPI000DC5800F|nr:hypothetical protein [Petrotoga sp. 9PW.55.5.1]RAO99243.1 hypothetical protein PW5551_04710 [Petrotoga sp. 9PW.55.5.1]
MDILTIKEYIEEQKEVSFLEIKEKFHLNETQFKLLYPFLRNMNANIQKVDKISPICNECPISDKCGKGFFNNCEYTKQKN